MHWGTRILGGQTALLFKDRRSVIEILNQYDNVLGLENYPQKTAQELREQIGQDDQVIAATIDTGWFGTHGSDAERAVNQLGDRVSMFT